MPTQKSQSGLKHALTHISLVAEDIEESTRFYEEVLNFEPIDTPSISNMVDFEADEADFFQILVFGDHQLHLWRDPESPVEATQYAHWAVHADNFEEVYERAKEWDAFAALGEASAPPRVFDFFGGAQMYLRDPTGNLLEVDHPNLDELDQSVFDEVLDRVAKDGDGIKVYQQSLLDRLES